MLRSLRQWCESTEALLVLAAVLVLCACLGRVMSRIAIVRLGYQVSAAEQTHEALLSEEMALKTELAARRSPDRLLRDGKNRFHLELARPEQIISVKQGAK